MTKPPLTQNRILLALAIAIVADAIQFPITGLTATGFFAIPGEAADILVDCVVMAATIALLGFHWALLPSLFIEFIPGLDLMPTWTACVAFVIWRRKHESRTFPVVDVQEIPTDREPPRLTTVETSPPLLPEVATASAPTVEIRLTRLQDLHAKGLITQAELEAKRQEILSGL